MFLNFLDSADLSLTALDGEGSGHSRIGRRSMMRCRSALAAVVAVALLAATASPAAAQQARVQVATPRKAVRRVYRGAQVGGHVNWLLPTEVLPASTAAWMWQRLQRTAQQVPGTIFKRQQTFLPSLGCCSPSPRRQFGARRVRARHLLVLLRARRRPAPGASGALPRWEGCGPACRWGHGLAAELGQPCGACLLATRKPNQQTCHQTLKAACCVPPP